MSGFINTAEIIGDAALARSIIERNVVEYHDDTITSIKSYCFYGCSDLVSVNCPNVTSLNYYAFQKCTNLRSVVFPILTSINDLTFAGSEKIETVYMPKLTKLPPDAFEYCSLLTELDFLLITSIGRSSFKNCGKLTTLIIRTNTVCTLENVNAFASTPIASGTGYIYVPRALVDSYKTAANWSTYASQFRALEDYTVDGTTTGKLDENKI